MINTELNNFWTHENPEIIAAKYRNSTVTSYTPCPEYFEKNIHVKIVVFVNIYKVNVQNIKDGKHLI